MGYGGPDSPFTQLRTPRERDLIPEHHHFVREGSIGLPLRLRPPPRPGTFHDPRCPFKRYAGSRPPGCTARVRRFARPTRRPTRTWCRGLLAAAARSDAAEARIDRAATRLIEGIRARAGGLGGIEDFLHAYSLSTKEGLALMVLAEALLRVPDAATADRLIEDKLAAGDWSSHDVKSNALLVSASAWTLGITARIIQPGETPDSILDGLIRRLGLPAVRAATRQAMRLLGSHFVLGQTIEEALQRAGPAPRPALLLRHAGRRRAHRRRRRALLCLLCARHRRDRRRRRRGRAAATGRASRSSCRRCIRASRRSRSDRVMAELVPRVLELARRAREHDLNFTIDAEEADRLELTLDVIARGAARSARCAAGTASGWPCRPTRSARRR